MQLRPQLAVLAFFPRPGHFAVATVAAVTGLLWPHMATSLLWNEHVAENMDYSWTGNGGYPVPSSFLIVRSSHGFLWWVQFGKICVFSNLDPCPWHHPVVSVEGVKYCDVFSVNVQLIEDERAADPAICSHSTYQRKMCGLFDIGLSSGTSCFL